MTQRRRLTAPAPDRNGQRAIAFIEDVLVNAETGQPFRLLDAEREFLNHSFRTDSDGRLLYPEQVYSCPKKSGKTAFAAMHLLTTICLFGSKFSEAFTAANDLEQASGRVYAAIRRIVEASPRLRDECINLQRRIEFKSSGATIQAIGADYSGAAGSAPTISSFDELWGYTSEKSRRLWDELVPIPTRKTSLRLTTTYAGFENESTLLLELYRRGLQQQQVGPSLYAGDGLLMFWGHDPIAPWQDEKWLAEMRRSLRPNQYLRMIENRWVASESSFIEMSRWDACVNPALSMAGGDMSLPIFVGIDASTKLDSTAIVAVALDRKSQQVRLVFHRIFKPTPEYPIDFESTVESTILDLHQRFNLRQVSFDPYAMQASAQRLAKRGVRMVELPQNTANLTAASQNLYELVQARYLILYPSGEFRTAVSRAVATETPRGWRISKSIASHRIDVVIALAMAALAAVQGQGKPIYNLTALAGTEPDDPLGIESYRRMRYAMYLNSGGRAIL